MSSTLKFGLTLVGADPIRVEWEPIGVRGNRHTGAKTLSRFRRATLTFPPLTTTQFAEWMANCDVPSDNVRAGKFLSIFLPRRVDATYAANPEVFNISAGVDTSYLLHYVSSRHGQGDMVYDLTILMYMGILYEISGGGS